VLLKLASEHLAVRNKVISICQHLNTRLQSPSVELPVAALLKQFKEQDTKLIRHFDLLYAQQGFKRLSGNEKNELVPILIKDISSVIKDATDQSGSQFFNFFLQALHHYEFPRRGSKDEDELRKTFGLSDDDARTLTSWFEKLILLELIRPSAAEEAARGLPGVTEDEKKFLNVYSRPGVWDPKSPGGLQFKATKLLVLKLLSTGAFMDDERFMPALLASAHRDSNIADSGEELLKHAIADVNVDDDKFIKRLYDVYLGTEGRAAAAPPLQIKILGVLQRSSISATFPQQCLRIIEQGIGNEGSGVQGREAAKLQTAIFTFANFFLRSGKKDELKYAAPVIITKMQQYIHDQGWPVPNNQQELTLRRNAYEMIGTCAKAGSIQDIALLDWLFRSLSDDQSGRETSLAVEHALAMMIDTFSFIYKDQTAASQADGDAEMADDGARATVDDLSELLYRYVEDNGSITQEINRRSTRYIAARFANRCLPFSNTIGRWIDILAAGGSPNEKMEVIEEGKKGLDPYWFSTLNSDRKDLWAKSSASSDQSEVIFPSFTDTFKQIFSSRTRTLLEEPEVVFSVFMKRYPYAIGQAIFFCWRIFVNEALEKKQATLPADAEWERRIENGAKQDLNIRNSVKAYVSSFQSEQDDQLKSAFSALIGICFEAVIWKDGNGISGCHDLFVQMLSTCPKAFMQDLIRSLDIHRLQPALKANDHIARGASAQAFGVLSLYAKAENLSSDNTRLLTLAEGYEQAVGATINQINGAIKALACALSRRSYADKDSLDRIKPILTRLQVFVLSIIQSSKDQTLLEAAYVAVEQFSVFDVYTTRLTVDSEASRHIIDNIFEKAKGGNEKAIKALGRFGVCVAEEEGEDSIINYLEEKLYKLHEIRELGAQFAVGEALCCLASGWANTALQLDMDVDLPVLKNEKKQTLSRVLQKTIKNCKASKPALRKASVIWLLCLVQFCGHLPEVQGQLRTCQAAFGNSLSERDDLVQEAASRGLGLVYEKGDRGLRDDLVRDLMKSFSSDKSNLGGGNVDEETTLFDPGALRTGDGDNSITTYKDILSLASEIGNPGLVYQFMSLAANNAVWSNRAAFANSGLKSILSDSSVGGYLSENPKLYTKLFRYRFDPNTNVQRSMSDIWNSLVKDSSATIEKYFDPIMNDLLANILTKEWRVRQACCEAISDLVQGRQLTKYEKYLTEIWTNCFRVLDDIKESVRVAAAKLARVLSQILVRSLEAGESSMKTAEAMLTQVFPFLLSSSGLESSAKDVQSFSLVTILEIVKKGSPKALRPFIPDLVERMLALFTDLEHEMVNYVHMNADKYKISEEKLDFLRLNSVRNSPVMEAVDRCFDLLDAETMEKTALAIERAMKASVGLPSKLACGNVLVSLTLRHRELFRPHAGRFLKLLEKYSLDRNDTASSTYAASSGYLCKLATDKQILKLVQYAKKLYLEDEDEKHRAVSADIIRAISKQVPDRFNSLASDILPFVFIAKHDGQEGIKELNTKTWEDNVGSMAVSLHLREIMGMSIDLLDSPRWNLKHSAARAVAEAIVILGSGYDGISEDQAAIMWPALRKALDGKTWEGKEVIIEAFAEFAEKIKKGDFRNKITSDVVKVDSHASPLCNIADNIQITIREAKRQNKDYQRYAIPTLGKVAAAFSTAEKVDWYKEVHGIVEPVIDDQVSSYMDKMDVDGRDAYLEEKRREKALCGCIESLEQSFLPGSESTSSRKFVILLQRRNADCLQISLNAFKLS
jgi:proteasome component ECM29